MDEAPNAKNGMTQACRQVAPSYYRDQAGEKESNLSDDNYLLIATQWYDGAGTGNVAPTVRKQSNRGNIKPSSTRTADSPTLSLLGNSTMETYERSNCVGCHSSSVFKQTGSSTAQISTDFMFWLTIEVPCGANGDDTSCQTAAPNPVPASDPKG